MAFIDLGSVLLVGFLILSGAAPLYNVALSASSDDETTGDVQFTLFYLHFSSSAFLPILIVDIARSSNGRTAAFGAVGGGSSPPRATLLI